MAKAKEKVASPKITIDLEKLLEQAYLHGKTIGHGVGRAEGIKFIAQTVERIIEKNEVERPTWWMATLVSCLYENPTPS